jgi:hypothetical protein
LHLAGDYRVAVVVVVIIIIITIIINIDIKELLKIILILWKLN